jgi:hypothetical protein
MNYSNIQLNAEAPVGNGFLNRICDSRKMVAKVNKFLNKHGFRKKITGQLHR